MNPFCESFEHYTSVSQLASKWDEVSGSFITGPDNRRWFSLGGLTSDELVKAVFLDTPNSILVGFAILPSKRSSRATEDILYFRDGTTAMLSVFLIEGTVQVRRGNTTILNSTVSVPAETRSYIEIRVVLDNSSGSVELQINGVPAGSFEGNTINSGSTLTNIRWGGQDTTIALRDIYIMEYGDFLGEIVVRALRPNGAGVDDDWTASAEGDNYEMVNQEGPDDNTYVSTNVHGARDLYEFENPAASTDSRVHFVQTVVRARKVDAGAGVLTMIARSGSDEDESEAHGLSEQFRYHVDSFTVNPATGQPWTIDELAAAQFGFKLETS